MAVALTKQLKKRFSRLRPLWHRSAPRWIVEQSSSDDPLTGWPAWQKYLASRKEPAAPKFVEGRNPPLLWGWEHDTDSARGFDLDEKQSVAVVLSEAVPVGTARLPNALHCLHLAYLLPNLVARLDGETWWRLLERLHEIAVEAHQPRVDWQAEPSDVLQQQLLAGELPLAVQLVGAMDGDMKLLAWAQWTEQALRS